MKRKFLFVVFLFAAILLSAQDLDDNGARIGFYASPMLSADVVNNAGATMAGEASYTVQSTFALGVDYVHPVSAFLAFESGLAFSQYRIAVDPMEIPGTNINAEPYEKNVTLINVPLALRLDFLQYFYLDGGALLDMDLSGSSPIDSQVGLGAIVGLGAQYAFFKNWGCYVNVYSKHHALFSFSSMGDSYRWRLNESGFSVGVFYQL